ncbi:MAG: hypothetical protein KAI33_07795 [Elusimicrobiales bacterium]|nr:hypothetical protein [Elusimicrobiales bacterium]
MTKLLAFICAICPLCIFTRAYPDLKFSKAMNKLEQHCPFCAAYKKLNKPKL